MKILSKVCIQRWVDEKQKGNNSTGVVCPQCGADYIIQVTVEAQINELLNQLDLFSVSCLSAISSSS